jgi:magnesium-protoporphyrin IX monomethyl ester (oxidative) cyclase
MSNKVKVLLINPPFTSYDKPAEIWVAEPLGLMYLAAFLRERGVQVEIFDAFLGIKSKPLGRGLFKSGLSEKEIRDKIIEFKPDIVGITSMFTMHSKGAHDVARITKEVSGNILVVFGGSHASAIPDIVLQDSNVDVVVIGEGEETLYEIVKKFSGYSDLRDILGIAIREHGCIKLNPLRPFIKNIDVLPFPSRDLVDMNIYFKDKYRNIFSMSPPRANVVTSRGCPFNCLFCSIHSIWRHDWRAFSAKKVCDEIELLTKKFSVREIAFQDDNLTLDKDRMHRICDEILKRRLKIKWCTPNGIAIWTLDKELLKKMKRSGCYRLAFGIETGSLKTQEFINKAQLNLEEMKDIIKYCNKIGIWTNATFIIGFPYETYEDIRKTVDYALDSDLDYAIFYIATPFPGTKLYDIYKNEGLLSLEFDNPKEIMWIGAQQNPMCDTKYFKREELAVCLKEANRKFYKSRTCKFMNPIRPLRKLAGMAEIKFLLKLVKMHKFLDGTIVN